MRIAIFLPKPTSFYISVLFAMKRGFEAHGVEVMGWTELPKGEHLREFCRQYKPDAIIEMNRSRNDVPELPREIAHVAWIVDAGSRNLNEYRDSEVLYFFAPGLSGLYTAPAPGVVEWLPPGFCPQIYFPCSAPLAVEFMFAGHIPKPWTTEELERIVYEDETRTVNFKELVQACYSKWDEVGGVNMLPPGGARQSIKACMKHLAGGSLEVGDPSLEYDVYIRALRMYNRESLMDAVLSITRSIAIYGPQNWNDWQQYAPYYRGFIDDSRMMRKAYQRASFVLHEGVGPHFRSLDCMGSGAVLAIASSAENDQPEGMNSLFEPHCHYIPFTKESFPDVVKRYCSNERERRRIGEQASELVHQKHTWRHRAEKILGDIRQCR